jgi:predicted alpha-1,2-mannosidase
MLGCFFHKHRFILNASSLRIRHLSFLFVYFSLLTTHFSFGQRLIDHVNPFIGTMNAGHTYPGASMPFGSVQLSPDTDTIPFSVNGKYTGDVYKYCAGYQYEDPTIVGFTHTHFSGTGHSDLGDILIMPGTGKVQINPGTEDQPDEGYRSRFSHSTEKAAPNYYSVYLEDPKVKAEMTTTTRVGVHRYTFDQPENAHLILDLIHGIYNYDGKNAWTFLRVENDTLITGYRQTNGWARTRTVYFAISFSQPIRTYGFENNRPSGYNGFWGKFNQSKDFPEIAGEGVRGHIHFDLKSNPVLMVKVALSPVSTEGAIANMRAEAPLWDFESIKNQGQAAWESELAKVKIEASTPEEYTNFYTALYHCYLGTTIYMDKDNRYKGLDQNIHTAEGFTNYTTFSLWDTYRALHPLYNILQPKRNSDMINSMLAHYDQSVHKMLPVWSHYANDNWCMIGYHSVSVLADAMVKGVTGFDHMRALEASIQTSNNEWFDGLKSYMSNSFYVAEDQSGNSVSKTLEFAYDDWTIAQMLALHPELSDGSEIDLKDYYLMRADSYTEVFDSTIGFMRPRLANGSFKSPFDPLDTHGQGFIEGNAWNYSLYVPHNPKALISLMGGDKRFIEHLDSLFTMPLADKYIEHTEDIMRAGIIGNYVHGNEPSHHVPFLYNWTSQPWKTQAQTRAILPSQYKATADGLGGNDDCGQMSAWMVFASLGFYPVSPGSTEYALTSPSVKSAELQLENGKTFTVKVSHQGPKNVYIQAVYLNGKPLNRLFITHADLFNGGTLEFHLGPRPNTRLGINH